MLHWTVFQIFLTSTVIWKQKVLRGSEIVCYIESYKCHDVDQGHSRKLQQITMKYIKFITKNLPINFLRAV